MDKPKREAILDLSKYVNENIRVKFTGGREVTGVLKGFDQLLNLVLDDVQEIFQTGLFPISPLTLEPPCPDMCLSFAPEQNPNKRHAPSVWSSFAVQQSHS